MTTDPSISDLYFTAANAVEERLPAKSKALIEEQDRRQREWRKAGFPDSHLAALNEARLAVDADPHAHVAMELRRAGNTRLFEILSGEAHTPPTSA